MTDYGTDIGTVFNQFGADIDPGGVEVSGRILLGQALVRRLLTPRGRLIDDPDYGYCLTDLFSDDLGQSDLGEIQAGVDTEMLKDERVISSQTTVTFASGVLLVSTLIQDGTGPFTLTLAVNAVSVTVLSIQ